MSNINDIYRSESQWFLWYEDHFDIECPRQLEKEGYGIINGLKALWSVFLKETVGSKGEPMFSFFDLWWVRERRSIKIRATGPGLIKMKCWIFKPKSDQNGSIGSNPDHDLLNTISNVHYKLLCEDRSEQEIVDAAEMSEDQNKFKISLSILSREH